jgi:hypothetical protein
MSENDDTKSPFGPGFIAACIVVGAILICGVALVFGGATSAHSGATTATTGGGPAAGTGDRNSSGTANDAAEADQADQADEADEADEAAHGTANGSAATPTVATPRAPDRSGASQAAERGTNSCALADGDQKVPDKAPPVEGWEVSRRVVVPKSAIFGPAKTDPDGFRRCFAHSPTGALFAAYNALAALADQRQAVPTVRKLMVPGANTDALIQELRDESSSDDGAVTQLAGFRILDADRDRATIMLALPVETQYMSVTLTLVWEDGDWRVQPPLPGNPVGAPFSQHRDLSDFVPWSGV